MTVSWLELAFDGGEAGRLGVAVAAEAAALAAPVVGVATLVAATVLAATGIATAVVAAPAPVAGDGPPAPLFIRCAVRRYRSGDAFAGLSAGAASVRTGVDDDSTTADAGRASSVTPDRCFDSSTESSFDTAPYWPARERLDDDDATIA